MTSSRLQNDAGHTQGARARRILIADDDKSVAFTFQSALELLPDCVVEIATSGAEALRLFESATFNVLITDYRMPDIDGMTLAVRIRQKYPLTAIVMITAFSTLQLREQAARIQIRKVLDKPVGLNQLRSVVREALEIPVRQSS